MPRKNLIDVFALFSELFDFKKIKRKTGARCGEGYEFDIHDRATGKRLGCAYDYGDGGAPFLELHDDAAWKGLVRKIADEGWTSKNPFMEELQPVKHEMILGFIAEVLLLRKKCPQSKTVVMVLEEPKEDSFFSWKYPDTATIRTALIAKNGGKGRISFIYENPLERA